MGVHTLFFGNKIDASAELAAQCDASDAAFVAAIHAFSTHDNPRPRIRRQRVAFLMRFQRFTLKPGDEWIGYHISHAGRSSIPTEFRDYIGLNWSKHFHE